MFGVLVNVIAIIAGGSIGLLVKKGIPQRFSKVIMTGLGLCTLYIGISGSLQGENLIVLVLSLVLGVAVGTALRLEDRLNSLGKVIERRISRNNAETNDASTTSAQQMAKTAENKGSVLTDPLEDKIVVPSDAAEDGSENAIATKPSFTQGFVTASVLFCVGAMAIIGSFESGLTGDHSIIYAKSTLDFVAALMLTVSLGFGVLFSAIPVLIYQGLLVLLAQLLRPILHDPVTLAEMSRAGSVIIIALGFNLIGISKIKIADFLPAIVFAPIFSILAQHISNS